VQVDFEHPMAVQPEPVHTLIVTSAGELQVNTAPAGLSRATNGPPAEPERSATFASP
jgi:hypothetical protein